MVVDVGSDCAVDETDISGYAVVVITVADVVVVGDDMVVEGSLIDSVVLPVVLVRFSLVDGVAVAVVVVGVDAVATEFAEVIVVV